MQLPTHTSRGDAIGWAVKEARRIASGELEDEPMGVFLAAQRIEHVLTDHRWVDNDFPPEVIPFVVGWNVSGPQTDAEIRQAAVALAAKQA